MHALLVTAHLFSGSAKHENGGVQMFKENDYVMYETAGVCQVIKVDYPEFLKDNKKQYYFLKPLNSLCDNIFVPVDSEAKMRKVMTREEATELIENIPSIEIDPELDASMCEEICKKALQSYDSYELVKMTKALYLKSLERKNDGKKPLQSDKKYLSTAEEYLFGELSVALDIPIAKVSQYIAKKVKESEMDF